jgi:hypothetical protein
MCWNQSVSINTFAFGIFVLLLIFFNNQYSGYKIDFFQNKYAYLFLLSIITMQLFEFILWRNLKNYTINNFISICGLFLLALQPFTSLLLLTNSKLRNILLLCYSIPAIFFLYYNLIYTKIYTTISKSGHLSWKWTDYNNSLLLEIFVKAFYLFFLFFSLLYNKYYKSLALLFAFFIINYFFYKDGSSGSIWCFFVNSIMVYFLCQILFILPGEEIIEINK